jgi:hypothetical protein
MFIVSLGSECRASSWAALMPTLARARREMNVCRNA